MPKRDWIGRALVVIALCAVVLIGGTFAFNRWWPYRTTIEQWSPSTDMLRFTTRYQWRHGGRVLFEHTRTKDSNFSRVVRAHKLMDLVPGDWVTGLLRVSGSGITCVGRFELTLTYAGIHDDEAVLINDLCTYGYRADANAIAALAMKRDPVVADPYWPLRDYPADGFDDAESFRRWWVDEPNFQSPLGSGSFASRREYSLWLARGAQVDISPHGASGGSPKP